MTAFYTPHSVMHLPRLDSDPAAAFPPVDRALDEPNGLLAFGGDLSPQRLMNAFRHGIFPWYSQGDPILWWSPDPRAVFKTSDLHLSRRFRRSLRGSTWTLRADHAFSDVIAACANAPRHGHHGTWILPEMISAYERLHELGHAHSVEVYDKDRLIGGVYGVLAGSVFCGESMFGHISGASKLALAGLCRLLAEHGIVWLDAQMHTPHLESLGVQLMPRHEYLQHLAAAAQSDLPHAHWTACLESCLASEFA